MTAALGFILIPLVTNADVEAGNVSKAPVAQTLVREGDFAISLSEALKVGTTDNEATAEDSLNAAGITPSNGWVSDYPVTPDIVGELKEMVGKAADFNKLGMSRDDALIAYQGVLDDNGLMVRVASEGTVTTSEAEPTPDSYNDADVDSYYSEYGPPPVSYYPPPWDYYYMYSWVPCDFWWGVSFFPGFFVLNDFSVVIIDRDRDHHRHGDGDHHGDGDGDHRGGHDRDRHKTVSNHVRDWNGNTKLIDPSHRREGKTFASVKDFRRGGNGAKAFDRAGGGRGILDRSVAREARRGGGRAFTGGGGRTRVGGGDRAFNGGGGRMRAGGDRAITGGGGRTRAGGGERAFNGGGGRTRAGGGERAFSGGGERARFGGGERSFSGGGSRGGFSGGGDRGGFGGGAGRSFSPGMGGGGGGGHIGGGGGRGGGGGCRGGHC